MRQFTGISKQLTLNAINKFDRKIKGKGTVRAGKGFTLFILNGDVNIIKIIKLFKDSDVLIDGVTEKVKHETKKQEGALLAALVAPLGASLVQPVISSVVKGISGRGYMKSRKRIYG